MARLLTVDQRREVWALTAALERRAGGRLTPRLNKIGPQTDDELWSAVYKLTGYRIPRVAVCEGHDSPFQIFADMYFNRSLDVLMIGNRGGGKRLALDCKLPTPTGWTTMGAVRDGDLLLDDQGRACRVVRAHPVEHDTDAYRVEFSDGTSVVADAEHLWYTEARLPRGGRRRTACRWPGVRTTKQIRDTLMTYTPGEYNHAVPAVKPLVLPERDLPIDPYVLGAWLGDGDSGGGTRLHTNTDEAAFFVEQLEMAGLRTRVSAHAGGTASLVSRQVWFRGCRKAFRTLGLLQNKHIPGAYLRASYGQRLALLQGLMDTDGWVGKDGRAELTTKSAVLRRGVVELLRSLGYVPTVMQRQVAASGNVAAFGTRTLYGPYYRIRFKPYDDVPPVRMPHKVARLKPRPARSMSQNRRITAVVPVDPVPMRCLTVDSPSRLYLCGESMVPTHNTTLSGFLHGSKCRWRPGYKALIAGATEKQSGRAYAEFKRFARTLAQELIDSLKSLTSWVNGSILEVITATMKGVNGPHPHLAQFDEAELSTQQIFEEFQNMAQGDDLYPAQNLLSTTRKFAFGIVQEIVKRCDQAIRDGNTPEWEVRIFCVFETLQNVPNCGDGCGCDQVVKGRWLDGPLKGQPRTFADVCAGRAKRSDGFVRLEDVHRRFKRLSQDTWVAQQECLRPDPEGLVHRWLIVSRHVLTTWYPWPEYGDVFRCWDWGGTNPHAVLWCQLLRVPVEHEGRVLPEGSLITFDEFYKGDQLSFTDLGIRIGARTRQWWELGYNYAVERDICDPAGGVAKKDAANGMANEGYPAPNWKSRPTPRVESIAKHVEWGQEDRLYIVGPMCPNLLDEYSKAHRPIGREGQPISEDMAKVDDHALDAQRMLIWDLYKEASRGPQELPSSNRDTRVTKQDKRPGMRGPLGRGTYDVSTMPHPASEHLHGAPDGGAGLAIGRGAGTASTRGRHSVRRARVPLGRNGGMP